MRPWSQPASAGLLPALQTVPAAITSQLGFTCVLLFFGALLAGALPLCTPISEKQMGVAAAMSAGLLIGAGLSVVIPEGFESFHEALQGMLAFADLC